VSTVLRAAKNSPSSREQREAGELEATIRGIGLHPFPRRSRLSAEIGAGWDLGALLHASSPTSTVPPGPRMDDFAVTAPREWRQGATLVATPRTDGRGGAFRRRVSSGPDAGSAPATVGLPGSTRNAPVGLRHDKSGVRCQRSGARRAYAGRPPTGLPTLWARLGGSAGRGTLGGDWLSRGGPGVSMVAVSPWPAEVVMLRSIGFNEAVRADYEHQTGVIGSPAPSIYTSAAYAREERPQTGESVRLVASGQNVPFNRYRWRRYPDSVVKLRLQSKDSVPVDFRQYGNRPLRFETSVAVHAPQHSKNYFGSGTAIGSGFVLTAAHVVCVHGTDGASAAYSVRSNFGGQWDNSQAELWSEGGQGAIFDGSYMRSDSRFTRGVGWFQDALDPRPETGPFPGPQTWEAPGTYPNWDIALVRCWPGPLPRTRWARLSDLNRSDTEDKTPHLHGYPGRGPGLVGARSNSYPATGYLPGSRNLYDHRFQMESPWGRWFTNDGRAIRRRRLLARITAAQGASGGGLMATWSGQRLQVLGVTSTGVFATDESDRRMTFSRVSAHRTEILGWHADIRDAQRGLGDY
jgi:hypothetical protein